MAILKEMLADYLNPPRLRIYAYLILGFSFSFLVSGGHLNIGWYLLGALGLGAWWVHISALTALHAYEARLRAGSGDTEGKVLGALSARHLKLIVLASAILALTFVASFGFLAPGLMLLSLVLNFALTYPRFEQSQVRADAAIGLLPACYVLTPMLLGSLAASAWPGQLQLALIFLCYAWYVLYLYRITPHTRTPD